MSSSDQSSIHTTSQTDAMSTKSTSTMATTKSLLRSILPSKKPRDPKATKDSETPAQKSERRLREAEAVRLLRGMASSIVQYQTSSAQLLCVYLIIRYFHTLSTEKLIILVSAVIPSLSCIVIHYFVVYA
ncbi:hypothetical protein T440DRAFT_223864 [Plenodomus tracheiphilus IPT5]|uniref:Uncharacterized protein n=1 Tax=Plenodomus tracheiphilus IPT5 TaxID=1408161 RepID=A0A6A7AWQ1_9PLEO|nr:hypothetical protein T440DRAFT_223864 [Plenodomus tracheiphilus IPT5]